MTETRRGITLDLWLTLIAESGGGAISKHRSDLRLDGTLQVLHAAGVDVDREALGSAYAAVRRATDDDHQAGVDLTFGGRVRQVLECLQPGLSSTLAEHVVAEIESAMDLPFLEHPPLLHPAAADVLASLEGFGLKIGLISNTGMTSANVYRRWLEQEGVLRYFDALTFSNEVASAKPSPGIFHAMLDRLEVPQTHAVHVGDNLHTDVAGAKQAGLKAIWISGHDGSDPRIQPDYTISDLSELPAAVEAWMQEPDPADDRTEATA